MYRDDLIRIEMARLNLKSSDVARQAGISESYFSAIRNGKAEGVRLNALAAIARVLGLPLKDLICEGEVKEAAAQ